MSGTNGDGHPPVPPVWPPDGHQEGQGAPEPEKRPEGQPEPSKPKGDGKGGQGDRVDPGAMVPVEGAGAIKGNQWASPRQEYCFSPEQPTIRELAERWGIPAGTLMAWSGKEGWTSIRDENARKMTQRVEGRLLRHMTREEAKAAKERLTVARAAYMRGTQELKAHNVGTSNDPESAVRMMAMGVRMAQQERGTSLAAAKRYATDFLERLSAKFPASEDERVRIKCAEVQAELAALYAEEVENGEED